MRKAGVVRDLDTVQTRGSSASSCSARGSKPSADDHEVEPVKDEKKQIEWPLFPGYCFVRFDGADRPGAEMQRGRQIVSFDGDIVPIPDTKSKASVVSSKAICIRSMSAIVRA